MDDHLTYIPFENLRGASQVSFLLADPTAPDGFRIIYTFAWELSREKIKTYDGFDLTPKDDVQVNIRRRPARSAIGFKAFDIAPDDQPMPETMISAMSATTRESITMVVDMYRKASEGTNNILQKFGVRK